MSVMCEKFGGYPEGWDRQYDRLDNLGVFSAEEIRAMLGDPETYSDSLSVAVDRQIDTRADECNGGMACYPGGTPNGAQSCAHSTPQQREPGTHSAGYLRALGVVHGEIDYRTLPEAA